MDRVADDQGLKFPLKPLHSDKTISHTKLDGFRRVTTNEIVASLRPGETGSLKARSDGTMLDGHHRVTILRERGIDVDDLPREIITRGEE